MKLSQGIPLGFVRTGGTECLTFESMIRGSGYAGKNGETWVLFSDPRACFVKCYNSEILRL